MLEATCEIQISPVLRATVSAEDYNELSQFKWYASTATSSGKTYTRVYRFEIVGGIKRGISMARQILGLEHGDMREADHIDHDTLNNTRSNLRVVTKVQNAMNRRSTGSSSFKGVYPYRPTGKWRASIKVGDKRLSLGYFVDEKQAAIAYDLAALDNYGEYAVTNFPHISQLQEAA